MSHSRRTPGDATQRVAGQRTAGQPVAGERAERVEESGPQQSGSQQSGSRVSGRRVERVEESGPQQSGPQQSVPRARREGREEVNGVENAGRDHGAVSQEGLGPIDESVRRLPAQALRHFVATYVGYRQAGLAPARHRGLPAPHLTLIITLDEPLKVAAHPDPQQPPGAFATLVGGLHTTPALITHDGRQSGIQLGLTPLGARALLGLPAGELANIDVSGSDLLGAVAGEWHERLRAAAGWPERFAALDDMLSSHARFDAAVGAEFAHAWRRLLSTGGRVSMADLAGEVGWSARHLGGRFQAETGLAPKAAARVIRFDRARRLLQRRWPLGSRPRSPIWLWPAATTTRPTLPVSSVRLRAVRRVSGSLKSSETSKPTPQRPRQDRDHDRYHSTTPGLADPSRPRRRRTDPLPG